MLFIRRIFHKRVNKKYLTINFMGPCIYYDGLLQDVKYLRSIKYIDIYLESHGNYEQRYLECYKYLYYQGFLKIDNVLFDRVFINTAPKTVRFLVSKGARIPDYLDYKFNSILKRSFKERIKAYRRYSGPISPFIIPILCWTSVSYNIISGIATSSVSSLLCTAITLGLVLKKPDCFLW